MSDEAKGISWLSSTANVLSLADLPPRWVPTASLRWTPEGRRQQRWIDQQWNSTRPAEWRDVPVEAAP